MSEIDPFEHDDAAYVLGALSTAETAAFEAHLTTCARCRERVAGARDTVAIIGPPPLQVRDRRPDTALPDTGLPDTVLPVLVRAVRREQRWRRARAGGLIAVAAACAIAFAVAVWPSPQRSVDHGPARALAPVARSTPIRASAQFTDHRWGTAIDLHCRYAKGFDVDVAYYLRVIDDDGAVHDAGSWTLAPGGETDFVGGTQVRYARIERLQVTLPNGQPVLQLSVH